MSTPKMRGLKQVLISLGLYNTNKFIDGKIVELAHQIGKIIQLRHNNFKQQYKKMVCTGCFNHLSLLYIFNKGRWGPNWEFRVGRQVRKLKNPKNNAKPHPLLEKWMIPNNIDHYPLIHVSDYFTDDNLPNNYWSTLLNNDHQNQLIQLIRTSFNKPDITIEFISSSVNWSMQRIKGFQFNKHEQTFKITFDSDMNAKYQPKCLVKMNSNHVMEFIDAITVTHTTDDNIETIYLCYGQYWPAHESPNVNDWLSPNYFSMDHIVYNEKQSGWNSMTNISEPVYLIHNCTQLNNAIKRQNFIPEDIKDMSKHDWSRRLLHTNTEIHIQLETENVDKNQVLWPCGPKWMCITHEKSSCMQCPRPNGNYKLDTWSIEWECNLTTNPQLYIFDAKNGLDITLMQTQNRYDE